MGLVSFLRTVLAGTDGGRAEFSSGPLDAWLAAQGANTSTASMNAVLAATVTREFALQVPAVLKGRNVICSLSTLPLVTLDRRTRERVASPLLDQIDPQVANVVTLAQTLEDLIFDSVAWWQVTKFEPIPQGYPVNARHLASSRVSVKPPYPGAANKLPSGIDPSSVVWVDGKPVDGRTLIRFDSPNPPLLVAGKKVIKRAALLDAAASMYAEDPRPLDYFTPAEDADPDDDDVLDVMNKWLEARRTRSTGWVPGTLNYHEVQAPTPADLQLVQLQQRTDLALANCLGLDPEDVGVSTTSRTYANVVDRRRDRINDTLAPYMLAITARLSMNDVTRRAQQVTFDLTDYLKADPKTQAEVAAVYLDRNVLSAQEVRADLGRPDVPVEPAAARTPALAPSGRNSKEEHVALSANFSVAAPEAPAAFAGAPEHVTFSVPASQAEFAVDLEKRTITGLAVPYGEVTADSRQIRFAPGSLEAGPASDPDPVLMSHYGIPLGVVRDTAETAAGQRVVLKISKTQAGDDALVLADDKAIKGLSVGVDIHAYEVDETTDVITVTRATRREVSLTPFPAFTSARIDSVTLSQEGTTMTTVADTGTTQAAAAAAAPAAPAVDVAALVAAEFDRRAATQAPAAPAPLDADAIAAKFREEMRTVLAEAFATLGTGEQREPVNPVREADTLAASVREPLPYRFDRAGNLVESEFDLSRDLVAMGKSGDKEGFSEAGKRVMSLLKAAFATATTDVDELNPAIQRPDMYVDQKDYRTPLWDIVNKGALPNGVQPFTFPKFSSASGLVGDHTEGTEPSAGSFVTTGQTVNPTAISGKAEINREVWDMGGNPQTSGLIWNQMRRGWRESLESATATFLNTLTAATDITITAGAADDVLADLWDDALAELQFARGYDFSAFAVEKVLYKRFVVATDSTGRKLFPILNGQNNNGSAASRFRTLDLSGVTGVPAWALASTSGSPNNSWLFDPMHVHGWATPPQELTFDVRVKSVDIGIFGYKAFANSDIAAVRQVIYDLVP